MSPLNHKRTTSSLAPPIIGIAKKIGNKKIEGSPFQLANRDIKFFNSKVIIILFRAQNVLSG
jgi:hypothetical protein